MELLTVQQIRTGFWRWCAPHPEWKPEKGGSGGWEQMVACVYYEAPHAVVLIDPLVPPAGERGRERFFAALDGDVARLGLPVAILLGNHYHLRSTKELYERYREAPGASVWAHPTVRVDCPVTHRYFATPLNRDILVFPVAGLNPDEVAFYVREHRAIVVADAVLGAGGGMLRVAPPSWAEPGEEAQSRYREQFRGELRRLLDLPIDMVLVAHGEPVLENGHAALAAALDAPAWGE